MHVRASGPAHRPLSWAAPRPPAALAQRECWRYVTRLAPWPLIATCIAIGVLWAVRTHLDDALELSVLAVSTTLALSTVFDDDADEFTAATPTPRWVRSFESASGSLIVLALAWSATVAVVVTLGRGSPPEPWWAMALGWMTIAATQLALSATMTRRQPTSGSMLPGLVLALLWMSTVAVPTFQRHLHPVHEHVPLWVGLLAAAVAITAVASRDRR